ncbi:MAG: hypothetical protein ACI9WC_002245 [Arenicella sp.]|jgi:hypothetical protein
MGQALLKKTLGSFLFSHFLVFTRSARNVFARINGGLSRSITSPKVLATPPKTPVTNHRQNILASYQRKLFFLFIIGGYLSKFSR